MAKGQLNVSYSSCAEVKWLSVVLLQMYQLEVLMFFKYNKSDLAFHFHDQKLVNEACVSGYFLTQAKKLMAFEES